MKIAFSIALSLLCLINFDNLVKSQNSVMPAKAGIQNHLKILDSRLRGNDAKVSFKTFNETINFGFSNLDVRYSVNLIKKESAKRYNKSSMPPRPVYITAS
jgi:hypothetical protein